jgi:hypothetical protein
VSGPDPQELPRAETPEHRVDRNLGELLQELRVAIPGVQVLFGFLLAVPFQSRFGEITEFQRDLYFATLLLTAASTALLIAPTAYHRITFRLQRKEVLVPLGNSFAIAGLTTLAMAMICAVTLVTDLLYGSATTAVAAVFTTALFGLLWFAVPVAGRR